MDIFGKRPRKKSREISPDEIFLDSHNLPGFDRERMEGRLEVLLSRRVARAIFLLFIGIMGIAVFQLYNLQIVEGEALRERAFENRIEVHSLIPDRGIIQDSMGRELAWNIPQFQVVLNSAALSSIEQRGYDTLPIRDTARSIEEIQGKIGEGASSDIVIADGLSWSEAENILASYPNIPLRIESSAIRRYTTKQGLAHVLGYVGYSDGSDEHFISGALVGKAGVEKYFDNALRGKEGTRLVEVNASGDIISESIQHASQDGETITLTVDADMQARLYEALSSVITDQGFRGGAGVIADVQSGEIRAITSVPEFDPNQFVSGFSQEDFLRLRNNANAPFFFRALEGQYAPGSIFKPVVALAALEEEIISPDQEILSTGSISIPNPYYPDQFSVFYDWKAHGWVDMRRALAVSSNVYFYTVGGGYEDQEGVGAENIRRYAELLGLGKPVLPGIPEETGSIPDPSTREDWRIGDTYNFSIGQGGVQVTPVQMVALATILARSGDRPHFSLVLNHHEENRASDSYVSVPFAQSHFQIVREGMHAAVSEGTAQALAGLGLDPAAKTGTAELGNGRVNSWIIGFFPYDEPRIAFAAVLESGDEENLIGAASAMRTFLSWFASAYPEFRAK